MSAFDYGPSPLADGMLLKQYRKDLGSGAYYDGQWSPTGLRHGLGMQIDSDALYYYGYWLDDKKHGRGRLVTADETVYEGDFKDDQYHGKGRIKGERTYGGSFEYEGDFEDGLKHGKGKETVNGEKYEGEFFKDERHGYGCLTSEYDDETYQGHFDHGLKHGKGK